MQQTFEELYERLESRWQSNDIIKKNIHHQKINKLLSLLPTSGKLLDIGRGGSVDGVLGVMAAKRGLHVTICSPKQDFLDVISKFAQAQGVQIENLVVCHPTELPFDDDSFDVISCIHVLEHIENYEKALGEIYRVTRGAAVIGLPTCLNLCVFARIGGADYFNFKAHSIPCLLLGLLKVLWGIITFQRGVYENNIENGIVFKHFLRFPWVAKSDIKKHNFVVKKMGADALCFPWIKRLVGVQRFLDRFAYAPFLSLFGFGTHIYAHKEK